jgi:hypothetical protein
MSMLARCSLGADHPSFHSPAASVSMAVRWVRS